MLLLLMGEHVCVCAGSGDDCADIVEHSAA
jgi:hypothetical protein